MKEKINKIIKDLGDNKSISTLLLQAQIIAFELENEDFSQWIYNEQNGYPDATSLPDYRILDAMIKADISFPYRLIKNYNVPTDLIKDKKIRERLSHVWLRQSLFEIEDICSGEQDKMLSSPMPAFGCQEINKLLQNDGNTIAASSSFSSASVKSIIYKFKSKLLDFFLQLNKDIDAGLDFSNIESQQKISQMIINNNTYTINAVNANIGNGMISTGNIESNLYQSIDSTTKEELKQIVTEIEEKATQLTDPDFKDTVNSIKEEINKPDCKREKLRIAFNAIKGILVGIVANELTPLVTRALTLLS